MHIRVPEIDMSELESLFPASNTSAEQGDAKLKSRAAIANKPEKVQLDYVLALEASGLDQEQVDNLLSFFRHKKRWRHSRKNDPYNDTLDYVEITLLFVINTGFYSQGYKGEKDKLEKCEQFFLELMKVPRTESKLRVFSFKMQFNAKVSDLTKNLNIVNSVVEQACSAVGFRLDSLLKLTEIRGKNNRMTLMHYLCKVLADKLPKVLDFSKDLSNSTEILGRRNAISKGLENVSEELSMAENDGPVSENFRKVLKEFLHSAEGEVRSLASLYSAVGKSVDSLILYFGEDPVRCSYEQVVSTLLKFVRMFNQANEENAKQLVAEKKKAEREASYEKLKLIHIKFKEEDKANDSQESLLYARTEYSNRNNDSSRGRGCGSYSRGRGEGCGRGNYQNKGQHDSSKNREDNGQKGKQHEQRDLSHIKCYHCDEYGYFVSRYRERNRNHEVNLNDTQEKDVYHEEDSWGSLLVKVPRSANRFYKAQPKVGKEDTNEVGRESCTFTLLYNDMKENVTNQVVDKEANPYNSRVSVHSPIHETSPENDEDDKSGSDDTPIRIAQIETIRLLIALAAGKGKRLCEDQAKEILKDVGMEDYNATLCPMKPRLKLSKVEDEPEVEATQYRKVVGCLPYLLHTRPDLTYSVGVVSRYMQSPRKSHARAIKQILRYLNGITFFGIEYKRGHDMRLLGYRSHNIDIDDGRSTTGHVFFYLGTSPITWCSQKQSTVALSSCEAEFIAATANACQAIWLRELMAKVVKNEKLIVEHVSGENQRADPLTKALAHIRIEELGADYIYFKSEVPLYKIPMEKDVSVANKIEQVPTGRYVVPTGRVIATV
ncbi:formin-like protein 13 isoform X1, partial [Tanacetum coccineum]